jgi:hypothetical protein
VTLSPLHGMESEYDVISWQSSAKAIALAVTRHVQCRRKPIFRVSVKRLGAAKDDIPAHELFDPMEW